VVKKWLISTLVWFPEALQFLCRSRGLKSQGYVVSFFAVMRDRRTEFERSGNGRARATADIIRLLWWVFSSFFTIASLEFGSLNSQNYTDVDYIGLYCP
jgi:hypothetical protein